MANTVTVTAANDTNPSNNSATDRDNLTPQNDVGVTKVDDKAASPTTRTVGTFVPGTSLIYTITVSNSEPSTATHEQHSFPTRRSSDLDSWTGSNGHSGTGAISDVIASLALGQS